MMGAKKITEATSGMGRTPGNSARQPFSSGRYGAPARSQNWQEGQGDELARRAARVGCQQGRCWALCKVPDLATPREPGSAPAAGMGTR